MFRSKCCACMLGFALYQAFGERHNLTRLSEPHVPRTAVVRPPASWNLTGAQLISRISPSWASSTTSSRDPDCESRKWMSRPLNAAMMPSGPYASLLHQTNTNDVFRMAEVQMRYS
jgi:hypothetical protein